MVEAMEEDIPLTDGELMISEIEELLNKVKNVNVRIQCKEKLKNYNTKQS